jgi:hypothetical protein
MENSKEMPRYASNEKVWALRIKEIKHKDSSGVKGSKGAIITPEMEDYADFEVDGAYCDKYNPEKGGYYILEKGGRESYFNEKPFNEKFILTIPTIVEKELINAIEQSVINDMEVVDEEQIKTLNWFEKLPKHIQLILHLFLGLLFGFLFGYEIWG